MTITSFAGRNIISRRRAIRMLFSAGVAAISSRNRPFSASAQGSNLYLTPASPLDNLVASAIASPGKSAHLAELSNSERQKLLRLLHRKLQSNVGLPGYGIVRSDLWSIGRFPNYTTSIPDGAPTGPAVCAACYGSEAIYHVNHTGQVRVFRTGKQTNPLDVAYDPLRHRLVVASADLAARVIIIDLEKTGNIVQTLPLASLTGQGESQGGIQGVTVDISGDYWLALAYFGLREGGVLVKIDGRTLQPVKIVKQARMNNPNGLITGFGGKLLYAMSDNGTVQEFDLGGTLLQVYPSIRYGYRGTVVDHTLWVCGWLTEGRMASIDLRSGERRELPCIPLANSVAVDQSGRIWVAGDAGVSVSSSTGEMLAQTTYGAFTNGLSVLENAVYFVSYDEMLNQARAVKPVVHVPAIHRQPAIIQ